MQRETVGADGIARRGETPSAALSSAAPENIWIETVAVGTTPTEGHQQTFLEYGRFRGWAYTDLHQIVDATTLNEDRTDFDRFDEHSIHLAALARNPEAPDAPPEVVGALRLIVDLADPDHPYASAGLAVELGRLPVEHHFPEWSSELDLRRSRVRAEVSRYISHHAVSRTQSLIALALRMATVAHFVNMGGDECFAVVEQRLARQLRFFGINAYRVTERKFLPQYDSENFGVVFDMYGLARKLEMLDVDMDPRAVAIQVSNMKEVVNGYH